MYGLNSLGEGTFWGLDPAEFSTDADLQQMKSLAFDWPQLENKAVLTSSETLLHLSINRDLRLSPPSPLLSGFLSSPSRNKTVSAKMEISALL